MNAGKSTLMNLLTQQNTSIVDSTPGTTADTKAALMEIHALGPVKLMDTPGVDERGELGSKKRDKVLQALKESDAALLVVDPASASLEHLESVLQLLDASPPSLKPLVLYNAHAGQLAPASLLQRAEQIDAAVLAHVAPRLAAPSVPSLLVDFHAPDALRRVLQFLGAAVSPRQAPVSVLPPGVRLDRSSRVLLNIPMDGETPSGRLLRPQAMVQEALLREYAGVYAFRMDLAAARARDESQVAQERERYREALRALATGGHLRLIMTDSQAVKEAATWSQDLEVPLTTFSVAMAHYMSGGRLPLFIEGLRVFEGLKAASRVLICEACNHDRIQDDIGTMQIPAALQKRFGADGIRIDHSFGREYQTKNLKEYDLILHCGGCMLDQQQMNARLADLESFGIPITNYGLVLSFLSGPAILKRVLQPWQI